MITGVKNIGITSAVKKANKKTPKFSVSKPTTKNIAPKKDTFDVAENLIFLHGFEVEKDDIFGDARDILQLLKKYRMSIVCGRCSKHELKDIYNALSVIKLKQKSDDYAEVIQEIQTLALVELAKKKIFLENVS